MQWQQFKMNKETNIKTIFSLLSFKLIDVLLYGNEVLGTMALQKLT